MTIPSSSGSAAGRNSDPATKSSHGPPDEPGGPMHFAGAFSMSEPVFFRPAGPFSIAQIVALTGAKLISGTPETEISGIAALDDAGPADLAFLDNQKYLAGLEATAAAAVLVAAKFVSRVPSTAAVLEVREPYRAFAKVAAAFFPDAVRLRGPFGGAPDRAAGAHIHAAARIEEGARIEPGAVVGEGTEIGRGTVVSANAVIGAGVRIGRDCYIGPGASIIHALIGNRVIVHPGVRIGQDGFGFAMGAAGHDKVPQLGRVIVQDDVEIGANSTVDRGAIRDTVIGEGTKIDNLVQIGHNVVIGRHCVIVSQTGISGSTTLEDFVVLGGQVGVIGHIRIGAGAQIAGSSNVGTDVPPGVRWGGTPARPVREWIREAMILKKLAAKSGDPDKN